MTTIVGIEYQGGVLIAGDRRACLGNQLETLDQPKVFRFSNALIGVAGTLLVRQQIEATFRNWNITPVTVQNVSYLIRETMTLYNMTDTDRQAEFLVAIDGKLYVVTSDGAYLRATRGYAAIGGGAAYALGIMAYADRWGHAREHAVRRALEIAAEFDMTTAAPFDFLTLEPEATA